MRRLPIALALACVNAYLHPPLGCAHPSHTSRLSRAAVVLKKGRAQGGSPKISLRKGVTYTSRVKQSLKHVPQGPQKRTPSLSPKRQWDRHRALLDAGVQPWCVFARAVGEVEWLEVGLVSHDATVQNASAEGAVQLHKRLILKHAARLYPLVLGAAASIELGLCEQPRPTEAEGEEVAASGEAAARVASAAATAAEPLQTQVRASPREACGFAGKPDENSGQYWTDANPIPSPGKTVKKGDASKKDTKSATAEAFSKMLGLRN
jgi:hypothetical protein